MFSVRLRTVICRWLKQLWTLKYDEKHELKQHESIKLSRKFHPLMTHDDAKAVVRVSKYYEGRGRGREWGQEERKEEEGCDIEGGRIGGSRRRDRYIHPFYSLCYYKCYFLCVVFSQISAEANRKLWCRPALGRVSTHVPNSL